MKSENNLTPVIYVDMDGVLAVWEQGVSEESTHENGHFRHKEYEKTAMELTKKLISAGYKVCILSAVYNDDHSTDDKIWWLNRGGLGDVMHTFVPYGRDKYAYVNAYKNELPVLIDDYSKNLKAWADHGYLAVKFMNGFNNLPKLTVAENGNVHMTLDSWTGYSIDRRMTVDTMYTIVTSIIDSTLQKFKGENE